MIMIMMILNSVGPILAYVSLNSFFRCALILTFMVIRRNIIPPSTLNLLLHHPLSRHRKLRKLLSSITRENNHYISQHIITHIDLISKTFSNRILWNYQLTELHKITGKLSINQLMQLNIKNGLYHKRKYGPLALS